MLQRTITITANVAPGDDDDAAQVTILAGRTVLASVARATLDDAAAAAVEAAAQRLPRGEQVTFLAMLGHDESSETGGFDLDGLIDTSPREPARARSPRPSAPNDGTRPRRGRPPKAREGTAPAQPGQAAEPPAEASEPNALDDAMADREHPRSPFDAAVPMAALDALAALGAGPAGPS